MRAMEISHSALDVEWRRLEIIAENLANANKPVGAEGGGYHARHLISGPRSDFASYLDKDGDPVSGLRPQDLAGVAIQAIAESSDPPRQAYEPGNPLADKRGFVSYPAVDQAEQMTLMIKTSRAYEANIVAFNMERQMYSKAIDLGRR